MGVPTIAALGVLASAAGTGVSIAAARDAQRRMNNVVRNQLAAAEEFQKQATPEFERTLGASGARAASQSLVEGERSALSSYQDLQAQPPTTAASPILGNSLVNVRNQAKIDQANRAQAAVQGYGNMALQSWLAQQRGQQNLGVISNLAGSRAAITPSLLQSAQAQGQDMAAIGSLLGTAGSLAGVYGSLAPYLNQPKPQPPAENK